MGFRIRAGDRKSRSPDFDIAGEAAEGTKWVRRAGIGSPKGQRSEEVFSTTDPALSPAEVVELFVRRWALDTTSQEAESSWGWRRCGTGVKPR